MNSLLATAVPLPLLLPLLSAMVYVLGALLLKRAGDLGADVWRTVRICNFLTVLMFVPLVFLGGAIPSWKLCWQPAFAALLFVAGQSFSLLAIKIGDVSVATPVLGVKILLVALLTTALIGERLGAGLWVAAGLSSVAIALLNVSPAQSHPRHHHVGSTIMLATLAAGSYALFDVLVQKWSPAWGAGRFLPVMMGFVGAVSFLLRPFGGAAPTQIATDVSAANGWVAGGAACQALQGLMIVVAIAVYGHATMANVLYSSRGLWSVLAVWGIGQWFANRERHHGPRVLAWRFAGATLMMAAIVIVLLRVVPGAARSHP